uniref:Uncharacterized protein n=1 Tax=Triticum urartu TaxID=4572 RepID=A0A8R7PFZ9_TRIUA
MTHSRQRRSTRHNKAQDGGDLVRAHEDREDNDEHQQWCTSRSEEVVVQGGTIIYLSEGRIKSHHLSSLKGMRTRIILSFSFPIFLISVHPNHNRDGWIISALCANEEDGGGAAHRLHIHQPRQCCHHQSRARRGRLLHQPDFAIFINFSPGEGTDCLDTPPGYVDRASPTSAAVHLTRMSSTSAPPVIHMSWPSSSTLRLSDDAVYTDILSFFYTKWRPPL